MDTKTCWKCQTIKLLSDFGKNKSKSDGLQSSCKKCRSTYLKNWYKENHQEQKVRVKASKLKYANTKRALLVEFFKNGCIDCPNKNLLVLEADHLTDKTFTLGESLHHHSVKRIKEELAKCEPRCANCHRIKTLSNTPNWRSKLLGR